MQPPVPPAPASSRPNPRRPTFVSRRTAGETIPAPVRRNMGDLESMGSLNPGGPPGATSVTLPRLKRTSA